MFDIPFYPSYSMMTNYIGNCKNCLAKVLDWNSFRTNPKVSNSFRNLYPHKTVSFQSNPNKFFNPNKSEVHSKSIRTYNPNESGQSKLIRINPNLQSKWIRSIWSIQMKENFSQSFGLIRIDRIHSDWKFELIELAGFIRNESSDWFGLTRFIRIDISY